MPLPLIGFLLKGAIAAAGAGAVASAASSSSGSDEGWHWARTESGQRVWDDETEDFVRVRDE